MCVLHGWCKSYHVARGSFLTTVAIFGGPILISGLRTKDLVQVFACAPWFMDLKTIDSLLTGKYVGVFAKGR